MKFVPTEIDGAFIVVPEQIADERGFFARTYSHDEFQKHRLEEVSAQASISFNPRVGTLRGLHYRRLGPPEAKLVRCTRGKLFDVVVDLRRESPTYLAWISVPLAQEDRNAVYVPHGCAHGFQTLVPDTEVLYQMSAPYLSTVEGGVRWDDPVLGINWPLTPTVASARDLCFPDIAGDA